LLEVILAFGSPGRFACGLDRRQQQCHENADDRDNDEKLY
jgi:hypothetical protein